MTLKLVNNVEVGSLAVEISPSQRGNKSLKKTTLPPLRTFRMKMKLPKIGNWQRKSLTKHSLNPPRGGDSNNKLSPPLVQRVEDSTATGEFDVRGDINATS